MSLVEKVFGKDIFETPHPIVMQRTELGRYATCPHQATLCREHADEIETHDVLPEAGRIVHAIQKVAIETCEKNLQEAADYIAEELPKVRPDLQPEILRAGRNLANEIRRFAGRQVLLYEEAITRSLMPATVTRGEILVVCEPDLVLAVQDPETILVLDDKTGYKDRTSAEAYDDFQTCVNSWILFAKYPTVNIHHWFYLNTRIGTRSYARIERQRDEDNFGARIFEAARLWLDNVDDAWPEEIKCSQCSVLRWCKYAEVICAELNSNPKAYIDNTIVLSELLKRREKAIGEATKNGRRLYGSAGYFDDSPKRKSPRRVSFKPTKTEVDNDKEKE